MNSAIVFFVIQTTLFLGGGSQVLNDDHRFQLGTHMVVNLFLDHPPRNHPKIRADHSVFRLCLNIPMDSIGFTNDGRIHYRAVVRTHRLEGAAILLGAYGDQDRWIAFALMPNDSVNIHVGLDSMRKVKGYHFEGKSSQIAKYYQKKSLEVGYIDPMFIKTRCENCNRDSIELHEQEFIRKNAPMHHLPVWLIKEEMAHAKMEYFRVIAPIGEDIKNEENEYYKIMVPEVDYGALRLNDHFLRSMLHKIIREVQGSSSNAACLMPGAWRLKDQINRLDKILLKASETKGCGNELVLRLLYDQVFPKLKDSDDFAVFQQLLEEYLYYQPYKEYLLQQLEVCQHFQQPNIVQEMLQQGLIKEGESFFIYIKSHKREEVPYKLNKYIKKLNPSIKVLILDSSIDHISGLNGFTYALSTREQAEFCCMPAFIGYNAARKRTLVTTGVLKSSMAELMVDAY